MLHFLISVSMAYAFLWLGSKLSLVHPVSSASRTGYCTYAYVCQADDFRARPNFCVCDALQSYPTTAMHRAFPY
jgi:hypothetical protein